MNYYYEPSTKPSIVWNNVDGAFMTCRDGTLHFLTLLEKLFLKTGITTLDQLDSKYVSDEPQRG